MEEPESDRFDVHWSLVEHPRAKAITGPGRVLLAPWPAPVNADACFEEAGFTDFADHGTIWERAAEELRDRLLRGLGGFGTPALVSSPLLTRVPWFRWLFRKPEPLPLAVQIDRPIHWDDLPPCRIRFGAEGVELVVGHGHELYWIVLPAGVAGGLPAAMAALAGGRPCFCTTLVWDTLVPNRLDEPRDRAE